MKSALFLLVLATLALPVHARQKRVVTATTSRQSSSEQDSSSENVLPPLASKDVQYSEVHGVSIEARTGWPQALSEGYYPIFVDLDNKSKDERRFDIEAESNGSGWTAEYKTRKSVYLAPGEQRRVELIFPAFEIESSSFARGFSGVGGFGGFGGVVSTTTLIVRRTGSPDTFRASFNITGGGTEVRPIVVTGQRRLQGGELNALAEQLESDDFEVQLSWVDPQDLPLRFESYTSLSAVVVLTDRGLPGEDVLEPLLTWVRLGGTVIFQGDGAMDQVRELTRVRPWLEGRFLCTETAAHSYLMGRGTVVVPSGADSAETRDVLLERIGVEPQASEVQWWDWPSIEALADLPYRGFAILMIVFAVLIGPVNFITLKKLKRNALLLVTIPSIALLGTGAVLVYGIVHQGLDVKRAEHSLTILDQREHQSSSVALRQLYAGLATRGGMLPGPGTVCLPGQESRKGSPFGISSGQKEYLIDMNSGVSMTSSYLPARVPVDYLIASDAPARLRLGVERAGESIEVSNELTVRVLSLVLVMDDGSTFSSQGGCGPGERVALAPAEAEEAAEALRWFAGRGFWPEETPIPGNSYLALVERDPFVDDCQLNSNEYEGMHMIVGILGEEDWR